jgi:hypothetical protein
MATKKKKQLLEKNEYRSFFLVISQKTEPGKQHCIEEDDLLKVPNKESQSPSAADQFNCGFHAITTAKPQLNIQSEAPSSSSSLFLMREISYVVTDLMVNTV